MSEINMLDLLDGTLDDLADKPEFSNYPAGAHRCTITWEGLDGKFQINKEPFVKLNLKGIETVELADKDNDAPISVGQEASLLFNLKNEYGQGDFKKCIAALKDNFGPGSNREIAEKSNGAEVLVVTGLRSNKEKTKSYMSLENIKLI